MDKFNSLGKCVSSPDYSLGKCDERRVYSLGKCDFFILLYANIFLIILIIREYFVILQQKYKR